MAGPSRWELAVLRKNTGGGISRLIPSDFSPAQELDVDEKDFQPVFPGLAFLFGERLPFFPSGLSLMKAGGASYLLPASAVLKNPAVFLREGTLLQKEDIDQELLEGFPVALGPGTRTACPFFGETDFLAPEEGKSPTDQLPLLHLSSQHMLLGNPGKHISRYFGLLGLRRPSELLYLSGVGALAAYPLLVYMGVSLFDSWSLLHHARANEFLLPGGGVVPAGEGKPEGLCHCPACMGSPGSYSEALFPGQGWSLDAGFREELESDYFRLLFHNYFMGAQKMAALHQAL